MSDYSFDEKRNNACDEATRSFDDNIRGRVVSVFDKGVCFGSVQEHAESRRWRALSEEVTAIALKGLQAVNDLIAESRGVEGLHRNGDTASWVELSTGGRFEEWLQPFDEALAKVSEIAARMK